MTSNGIILSSASDDNVASAEELDRDGEREGIRDECTIDVKLGKEREGGDGLGEGEAESTIYWADLISIVNWVAVQAVTIHVS